MYGLDSVAVMPAALARGPSPPFSEEVLYDIVASMTLPVVDISRSVRSVLLNRPAVERLNHMIAKTRIPLFLLSNVAIGLVLTCHLGRATMSRWLAIPTFLISLPAPLIQMLMMRYEIVLLLLRTYDFWFFTTIWTASMLLFCACLGDARLLVNFGVWFSMQANIMIDATVSVREAVYFTVMGLFFSMVMIAALALGVVDELHDFAVLSVNGYQLTAQDIVINGWSTCLLILFRNLYRRRTALRDHGANKTVVQCLSYRCRVRLRSRTRRGRSGSSVSSVTSVSRASSAAVTKPTASYFQNAKMVQLRCMRNKIKFSPRNLMAPFAKRLFSHDNDGRRVMWLRMAVVLLMGAGVLLTVVSFVPVVGEHCRVASLATTLVFFLLSLVVCHRQLLKFLVFSFDFAFLSFQLTVMHVALCDLFRWDSRSFAIASVWLWVHWVITFDCMPPEVKSKLRLRYRFVVVIALHFVVAHVLLVYQLVISERETFRDRAIVNSDVLGFHIHITVLPLLISRMLMTFGWSCRIVWRLLRRNENELIIIQGTVTYINNRRKFKQLEDDFQRKDRRTSKVQQFARLMTRRLSGFGAATVPDVSALSNTETHVSPFAVLPSSPPVANTRLTNIASQIHEATRALPQLQLQLQLQLQQPRRMSLAVATTGGSRREVTVFDASGSMQFETNRSRRASVADAHTALMKITMGDAPDKEEDNSRVPTSTGLAPMTRMVVTDEVQEFSHNSEDGSEEYDEQHRLQI